MWHPCRDGQLGARTPSNGPGLLEHLRLVQLGNFSTCRMCRWLFRETLLSEGAMQAAITFSSWWKSYISLTAVRGLGAAIAYHAFSVWYGVHASALLYVENVAVNVEDLFLAANMQTFGCWIGLF